MRLPRLFTKAYNDGEHNSNCYSGYFFKITPRMSHDKNIPYKHNVYMGVKGCCTVNCNEGISSAPQLKKQANIVNMH